MNKRGSIFALLVFGIIIVGLIVAGLVAMKIQTTINSVFQADSNMPTESKAVMQQQTDKLPSVVDFGVLKCLLG